MQVPPLRSRREDLCEIAGAMLGRANRDLGLSVRGLTAAAIERLQAHAWPGNLRELENALRASALATREDVIGAEALPGNISRPMKERDREGESR
jgi:DNA-binding NtrC family response regulator